ncbi:MAG: hypothetical protein GQ559_03575 [Desulfobulbaceae bacterium]|nr:hypothetical protein [Desulfobulbaceae bacterium]
MKKETCSFIFSLMSVLMLFSLSGLSIAAEREQHSEPSAWDSAVNSLLAAGMYGIAPANGQGLAIGLQRSDNMYRGLEANKAQLNGQSITFSYEGSSGLLGFSAGYIYTSTLEDNLPGTVFLGIDPAESRIFDPFRSWYLAFDLSQSYQLHEDFSFGIGSKTMLMKNPFETREGRMFSLLFNMPLSYKSYITITPELQWSRPLPENNTLDSLNYHTDEMDEKTKDIFYGGVSISFSY